MCVTQKIVDVYEFGVTSHITESVALTQLTPILVNLYAILTVWFDA